MEPISSPVNVHDRRDLGIKAGDTVRVWQKIQEKGKTRLQSFEGLVLARKHGAEAGATFTVRRVSGGVGVEKIFPLYSPMIDKIEIVRRAKMRRAKLYYLREKVAREIKRQMRNMRMVQLTTESDTAAKEAAQKAEEEEVAAAEESAAQSETEAADTETADNIEEKAEDTTTDSAEKKETAAGAENEEATAAKKVEAK